MGLSDCTPGEGAPCSASAASACDRLEVPALLGDRLEPVAQGRPDRGGVHAGSPSTAVHVGRNDRLSGPAACVHLARLRPGRGRWLSATLEPCPTHASLATPYRTHTCGELRAVDAGTSARLAGWVHRRRDHGQLIFLDLRDRHGITQVVIDAADAPEAHEIASRVRGEFVVAVMGEVATRQRGHGNAKLPTGEIELHDRDRDPVRGEDAAVLHQRPRRPGRREPPPQVPLPRHPARADGDRLLLAPRMVQAIREVHHDNGFVEVETPTSSRARRRAPATSSSRRLQPGSVYALPQSPQQLKQLLMVAGIDRYFQIARCYRDEDLRGDRQPEFTQLDLEMSFVDEDDVMGFIERCHRGLARDDARPADPRSRSRVFTYDEAMERFGSDKPDLRFGMELIDLAPALVDADGSPRLRVFDGALVGGGRVKAIVAPGLAGRPAARSTS